MSVKHGEDVRMQRSVTQDITCSGKNMILKVKVKINPGQKPIDPGYISDRLSKGWIPKESGTIKYKGTKYSYTAEVTHTNRPFGHPEKITEFNKEAQNAWKQQFLSRIKERMG